MSKREQLEEAIANLEAQRALLGDATVEAATAGIRAQLKALEPLPEPKRQRKQVTVLFADVSGFTAMSETMDAEDVQETMNALWQRVDGAILEHGGHIDKHIGDAVMALWGVEQSREDDPEQAIKAALAMQTAVADFATESHVTLKMRIGLNTGPVLLGEVGTTGEYTAMGDTVNVASRLEHAAPIGRILINHATYRQVRGVFDVEALDPLPVKGKSDPLQVYLVQRAKPRAFRIGTRGIEGIETRMIGRDAELRQLQAAYEAALADNQMVAVTVVGEAGLGKSRLLYEFENWLELRPEHIWYFKGRTGQQQQGMPLGLIRDMLTRRFQIRDSDPLPVVREKFTTGVAQFLPDDEKVAMKAAVLGSWVGHDFTNHPLVERLKDDPQQIHNRALLYLAQLINRAAQRQPVLMLFEDIHWSDASSLAVAQTLIRRPAPHPICIIGITRPTLYERQPDWGEDIAHHTRLNLEPLPVADTQLLVAELLHRIDPLPPMLVDLVVNRAEGNPFYAEELLKMLIDNGAIQTDGERWQVVADQLVSTAIPPTLTGILQARLDRLLADEKTTLQQASVIGRIFWDAALVTLSQTTVGTLPALHSKEFIFPRQKSTFADTMEYIFKHALLRDVTYESVLKRQRRHYHQLAAEWLAEAATVNARKDEFAALIGEHYHRAQQEQLAGHWYGRAGHHAVTNYAHQEAVHYLTLALELTPVTETATRYALLLAREKTYSVQGDRPAQQTDLAQLVKLAGQLDKDKQAQVTLRQAQYAVAISDYEEAIAQAQAAIALAEPEELWEVVARGYAAWGTALRYQGHYALAQEMLHQGLAYAQMSTGLLGTHQKQTADCLNGLGLVAWRLGEYTTARNYLEQALTLRQEIADQLGVSMSLSNLGNVAYDFGEYAIAHSYYEQALAIRQEIGDRQAVSACLNNLGAVAWNLGEYAAARSYLEQALAIFREIGDRQGVSACLHNLGALAWTLGEYAAARSYYEQSLTIDQEIGDRQGVSACLNNLGFVALHLGEYAAARSYLEQALAIRQEIGDRRGSGITRNHLGILALRQNQLEPALTHLQQAVAIRQELEQPQYVAEDWVGLAKIAFLQGDRAQTETYLQQILTYLQKNPTLAGAEDPMRAFHWTWELLLALDWVEDARHVLTLAAHIIQTFLDKHSDPGTQATYLNQPHHQVLWAASEARQ